MDTRILLLGATGKVGREVLQKLLAANKTVTVLVRDAGKLPVDKNLTVLEGDALSEADLRRALSGVEAVISVLGHSRNSPENLLSHSLRRVIKVAETPERLRIVTMAGVRAEADRPGLFDRFVNLMLKTFSGKEYRDWYALEEVLRNSKTPWTIVRAPRIVEEAKGTVGVGYVGDDALSNEISATQLAQFITQEALSEEWVQKLPYVACKR